VYCVWQVVKTPTIISNNPVYMRACVYACMNVYLCMFVCNSELIVFIIQHNVSFIMQHKSWKRKVRICYVEKDWFLYTRNKSSFHKNMKPTEHVYKVGKNNFVKKFNTVWKASWVSGKVQGMVVLGWRNMPGFDCMAALSKWVETFRLLFSHHIKPNKSGNLFSETIFHCYLLRCFMS